MKIQCVGDCNCQRKNGINFKARHLQNKVLLSGVEEVQRMPSQVYKERGFKDFLRHPLKFLADFVWTVSNGTIRRLTRAMSG